MAFPGGGENCLGTASLLVQCGAGQRGGPPNPSACECSVNNDSLSEHGLSRSRHQASRFGLVVCISGPGRCRHAIMQTGPLLYYAPHADVVSAWTSRAPVACVATTYPESQEAPQDTSKGTTHTRNHRHATQTRAPRPVLHGLCGSGAACRPAGTLSCREGLCRRSTASAHAWLGRGMSGSTITIIWCSPRATYDHMLNYLTSFVDAFSTLGSPSSRQCSCQQHRGPLAFPHHPKF